MGFKCPICLKDFQRDKQAWRDHIKTSHSGAGDDAVEFVKKITEGEQGNE